MTVSYKDFLQMGIKTHNVQILPTSIIIKSFYYDNDLIKIDYEENNKGFECWVAEIYYENIGNRRNVLKVGLKAYTNSKKKELLDLGGIVSEHSKETVYFSENQIITMIKNSKSIRNFFYIHGITMTDSYELLLEQNYNRKGIELIEDNSHFEKLNKWKTKATVLGVINNYDIDYNESKLKHLNIYTSDTLSIPPVRTVGYNSIIGMLMKSTDVTMILIPDTVKKVLCNFISFKNVTEIHIGNKLVYMNTNSTEGLKHITYIDFKNVINIPSIRNITKLSKIKVRIDCELPFNFVSDLSNLKEIEFKLGD